MLLAFRILKEEFCKEYRSLNTEDPSIFQQSEWQSDGRRRKWYICYKWLVCIYLLYGLFYDWLLYEFDSTNCKDSESACRIKWFIYCTSWGYLLLICQALMAAYLVTMQPASSNSPNKHQSSTFQKIYWAINNMAYGISLNVTLVYWTLVHSADKQLDFSNIKGHVTNSILVLLDLMLVAQPVRLLHAYLPMAVGLTYASFSAVYYYADGTNRQLDEAIYPVYNWRHPLKAALVGAGCEIGILLMHILAWCVFLLRKSLAAFVKKENPDKVDIVYQC